MMDYVENLFTSADSRLLAHKVALRYSIRLVCYESNIEYALKDRLNLENQSDKLLGTTQSLH